MMKPTEVIRWKLEDMIDELRYLRAFWQWMVREYDKFYRLREEFNSEYDGEIPRKYRDIYN